MDWLLQNWLWIVVLVGAYFMIAHGYGLRYEPLPWTWSLPRSRQRYQ